jgi:hypothetical protein
MFQPGAKEFFSAWIQQLTGDSYPAGSNRFEYFG